VTTAGASDLYWSTASAVCTAKQLRILELREAHGFSLRTISFAVCVSLSTVRDHVDAAHRRIDRALRASSPSGGAFRSLIQGSRPRMCGGRDNPYG
jgi:hypothetical protein